MSTRNFLLHARDCIRYGRLAEVVLYDVRRTMTLAGPSAVYVDREVEAWLGARTRAN